MANFSDFFKSGRNRKNQDIEPEYFEDTHNERGEYIGSRKSAQEFGYSQRPAAAKPLPQSNSEVTARQYQNVVVYEPTNPDDVEMLIDYMKRREPAIINLDNVELNDAQRILDFVSGAIFALNGSVHRIASNIFLLSPEGVEITVPYEPS